MADGCIVRRGDQSDDVEAISCLAKVRAIFRSLSPPFTHHLDATRTADEVLADSARILDTALAARSDSYSLPPFLNASLA